MRLSPQKREELKKDFKNAQRIIVDYGQLGSTEAYAFDEKENKMIVEYWLSIIDQLLIEKQERIGKKKQEFLLGVDNEGTELYKAGTGEMFIAEGLDLAINILKE